MVSHDCPEAYKYVCQLLAGRFGRFPWFIFFSDKHEPSRKLKLTTLKAVQLQAQVPPRFELGSLDSKAKMLTITPVLNQDEYMKHLE